MDQNRLPIWTLRLRHEEQKTNAAAQDKHGNELLKDSDEYLAVLVGPHAPPYDDYGASNETHVHADYGARGFRMEVD
ncbi:hypothetical protein PC116_g1206 [Phytophthora cactorum]|uniref:Uncharacterized protein n=1 Tax=Phytophthora cactorum TaxID=29920 RepID=A0A8T1EMX5_9STRA|nr:hypothetical protein PC112_g13828 [Phytophthora cactorum]KAG2846362.1 hypothetical protein PC111_g1207 [Phytophthora cactorum]KAG2868271.1 hypothetical protein PC113_g1203 [Phytophthora cactorum]KAG2888360.1 hypothetical protein PC115_g20060 [Phytophthora cactorum]KAG2933111.1 hypothetical protein PC114_g1591 [Phytophthora cactorum]